MCSSMVLNTTIHSHTFFLSCKTETLYLLNNNYPVITMNKGSNFSTSLPMLVVVCFTDRNHPNECEVITHYSFYLHFPNGQWCWASFHVLLGYLYIFLVEVSIYVLYLFLNQVAFLLLSFKCSLYTLYINALKICQYSLLFCCFPFYSVIVPFDAYRFKIFMQYDLSNFSFVTYVLSVIYRKSFPSSMSWSFCPIFS